MIKGSSPPGRSLEPRQTAVLDHAAEFVDVVYRQAPAEYQRLLATGRYDAELARRGVFNHGKLYTYAEFCVFRHEFLARFPDASASACVNAFSGLFLKNDISIHNLVEFIEGVEEPPVAGHLTAE